VNREGAIWEKTIDDNFKEKRIAGAKRILKRGRHWMKHESGSGYKNKEPTPNTNSENGSDLVSCFGSVVFLKMIFQKQMTTTTTIKSKSYHHTFLVVFCSIYIRYI